MGFSRRAPMLVASLTLIALLSGCFGYNKSAKRWAYVGDAILLVGGGTAIAIDVTEQQQRCMPDAMGNGCTFQPKVRGAMIGGIVLAAAGLFGILFNATRDDVKTAR